jgi:uncharacterized protein (DUF302 family)
MSSLGITQLRSRYSVSDTISRLESLLNEKGTKIFARIDQRREAQAVGLDLPPTELLFFGNPRAGTGLMQQSLTAAIDLPLKIAVAEDASGRVWILFNDAEFLRERHGLPEESMKVLGIVAQLVKTIQE